MLDRPVRKLIDPSLEALAARIAALGLSANACTVGGFLLGMVGCVAIAHQQYILGLVFILANRLADGLDGCIARHSRSTDVGGFLDFVLDVLFYGGVPLAFAVAQPANLLPASFLLYSFLGTSISFLAYAVIAAKRGIKSDHEGRKSFFYSAGLMEGTETILFFTLFCLFPHRFALLAWIFGSLCWATVALRIVGGVLTFSDRAAAPSAADHPQASAPEHAR
jgi:phosphatidylglycerophosphate synthase